MACKQGIRKHIEAARVYYREQRKPEPFRDHWTALVHRVHDVSDGFYRLSHQERIYYLVQVLQGEVYNGGISQFFDNSSGDHYLETLAALDELGAMRCRALLLAARQILFAEADPPTDRAARYAAMPEYPSGPDAPRPAWCLELDRLDKEFYADPDKLEDRLRRYALDHKLVQI
jgi:hypothetical protein